MIDLFFIKSYFSQWCRFGDNLMEFVDKFVSVEIDLLNDLETWFESFGGFEFEFGVFIKVFERRVERIGSELELSPEIVVHTDDSEGVFIGKLPYVLFEFT